MNFIISASTDVGNTKKTNQDSLAVQVLSCGQPDTPSGGCDKLAFAVMCDGMGGLEKGEVASASVVNAFRKWARNRLAGLYASGIRDDVIRREWTDIIVESNEKIKLYGKKCAVNLGTTVTAVLLTQNRYYIVNVGDSRAYEIIDGASLLTRDQTLVAQEVEQGNLTLQQAEVDPRRSVLLQCVGASDAVYPDFFFGETKRNAVYMLCSDGFRHEVSGKEIWEKLKPDRMLNAEMMKSNEMQLIDLNKQRQERDNISVITIRTF